MFVDRETCVRYKEVLDELMGENETAVVIDTNNDKKTDLNHLEEIEIKKQDYLMNLEIKESVKVSYCNV